MKSPGFCLIVTLSLSTLAFSAHASEPACPEYAHRNVVMGEVAELPDGWMAFRIEQKRGIYKSEIKNFNPTLIPNTNGHKAMSIDMSTNAEWLVYVDYEKGVSHGNTYVIRLDGTGRAEVPTPGKPRVVGFIKNGANGDEIFYLPSEGSGRIIYAVEVNLPASGKPTFGNTRKLANLDRGESFWKGGLGNIFAVSREGIFGLMQQYVGGRKIRRNGFVTIPNGGLGTATSNNVFQWSNDNMTEDMWGCGHTMSWDGQFCATNSGNTGDGACVPNKKSYEPLDHKGIYITPFFKDDQPQIDFHDQIDVHGISTNWCPERYRFGAYNEVDFTYWYFSNHPYYLIGTLQGELAPEHCLWVLYWPTNTWTRVTPADQTAETYIEPVMYFPGIDNVRRPLPARGAATVPGGTLTLRAPVRQHVKMPADASGFTVYSAQGRQLWHYRHAAGSERVVSLPASLSRAGLLVVRFQ